MVITTTAGTTFQKIYLDTVGPIETDSQGFSYFLTLQCELSKYVEAYPLVSKDTITIAITFIENFVLRYGVPDEIATDQGTEFISSIMKKMCNLLHIKHISRTAYHHESIGSLESTHKVLNVYLGMLTEEQKSSWSTWIPY